MTFKCCLVAERSAYKKPDEVLLHPCLRREDETIPGTCRAPEETPDAPVTNICGLFNIFRLFFCDHTNLVQSAPKLMCTSTSTSTEDIN